VASQKNIVGLNIYEIVTCTLQLIITIAEWRIQREGMMGVYIPYRRAAVFLPVRNTAQLLRPEAIFDSKCIKKRLVTGRQEAYRVPQAP